MTLGDFGCTTSICQQILVDVMFAWNQSVKRYWLLGCLHDINLSGYVGHQDVSMTLANRRFWLLRCLHNINKSADFG